ncbi:MAG: alanine racemase C-terminal domain-containing protein, partial [Actinomycetota bacterium]
QLAALLPDDLAVSEGDEVVLIGAQGDDRIRAEEHAQRLGTIAYEVTCGIGTAPARTRREAR